MKKCISLLMALLMVLSLLPATDVAAIYDCLTQDITPACGDRMACDVNMDGYVDVYDLQYLYECVAQNQ